MTSSILGMALGFLFIGILISLTVLAIGLPIVLLMRLARKGKQ